MWHLVATSITVLLRINWPNLVLGFQQRSGASFTANVSFLPPLLRTFGAWPPLHMPLPSHTVARFARVRTDESTHFGKVISSCKLSTDTIVLTRSAGTVQGIMAQSTCWWSHGEESFSVIFLRNKGSFTYLLITRWFIKILLVNKPEMREIIAAGEWEMALKCISLPRDAGD